ncbi:hypothetical protein STAS_06349 [Striga asiatica]|uniref:Uncharacterized protein n=1 Tax=Striga asiatica TaxID=4170 RepID=A0A5A7PCI6_STRAF|nr:hypothetical protein STAS_06349 [Striga asiatica]
MILDFVNLRTKVESTLKIMSHKSGAIKNMRYFIILGLRFKFLGEDGDIRTGVVHIFLLLCPWRGWVLLESNFESCRESGTHKESEKGNGESVSKCQEEDDEFLDSDYHFRDSSSDDDDDDDDALWFENETNSNSESDEDIVDVPANPEEQKSSDNENLEPPLST